MNEPIAVVGMGCRLPGGANSPDELWALLEGGTSALGAVPSERWDAAELAGMIAGSEGGFLEGVDLFDSAALGIR